MNKGVPVITYCQLPDINDTITEDWVVLKTNDTELIALETIKKCFSFFSQLNPNTDVHWSEQQSQFVITGSKFSLLPGVQTIANWYQGHNPEETAKKLCHIAETFFTGIKQNVEESTPRSTEEQSDFYKQMLDLQHIFLSALNGQSHAKTTGGLQGLADIYMHDEKAHTKINLMIHTTREAFRYFMEKMNPPYTLLKEGVESKEKEFGKIVGKYENYTDEEWHKAMAQDFVSDPNERKWQKAAFYQLSISYNILTVLYSNTLKWWNQILKVGETNIFLGAIPLRHYRNSDTTDLHKIIEEGIGAVLCIVEPFELENANTTSTPITREQYRKAGLHHLHIPSADLHPLTMEDISKAVEYINWNVKKKISVYVHCKAGKGRSFVAVICYLIKYHNMSFEEAYNLIQNNRPQINPNSQQIAMIKVFERLCRLQIS